MQREDESFSGRGISVDDGDATLTWYVLAVGDGGISRSVRGRY